MSNNIFKTAVIVLVILALCSPTLSVKALTAEELYETFDIDYVPEVSKDDLDIIQKFNYAKRYVQMFRYVADSTYDTSAIESKIETAQNRLAEIEQELLGGYSLSTTEIYDLEAEYQHLAGQILELASCTENIELDYKGMEPTDIPSYEDYLVAVANKNLAESRCQLGDSKPSVITNTHLVSDFDSTTVTYVSTPLAVTTSLFNGVVVFANDTTVTINHYNNIYTSYRGLTPCVEKGDTIGQGQCIGYSSGTLSVRMKVGGEFVNIHSYLEASDDL